MKQIREMRSARAAVLVVTAGVMVATFRTGAIAGPQSSGQRSNARGTGGSAAPAAARPETGFDLPNSVKVILPADPPPGQEYSGPGALIVPPGMTWKLVGFTFNVTYDTTKAGSGNVSMIFRDPDGIQHLRLPLANGLDRAVRYIDFSAWIGATLAPTVAIDHACILTSLPDLTLPEGWQITTLTEGRRPTDRVKEMQLWVEELPA